MRRRSLILAAACSLVLLGVGWLALPPGSAICRANYDRLAPGMTLSEVEQILGGPARDESTGRLLLAPSTRSIKTLSLRGRPHAAADETWRYWSTDTAILAICFDKDGYVAQSAFTVVYRESGGPMAMLR